MGNKTKTVNLDDKDKEILFDLSLNGRLSLTRLAEEVSLSKQVVAYRLKQMEENQIIKKYYAITNVYNLGKTHYRVFLKYRNINPAIEKELTDYLVQHPNVAWVLFADGDFDLIFVVWADNIIHFEKVHDEIMERYSHYFGEKYFSIATRIEYLPYRFLQTESTPISLLSKESVILGDAMNYNHPDDLEKKILNILKNEGRIAYTELAKKCGVSVHAVKNRIARLEHQRIIVGYNVKIDHNLLGYSYLKVLLKLNKPSGKELEALCTYLKKWRNVIYLLKTIGSYDFEFELMTSSNEEFYGMMRELRRDFSENINEYSVVTMNEEPKYEHLAL